MFINDFPSYSKLLKIANKKTEKSQIFIIIYIKNL